MLWNVVQHNVIKVVQEFFGARSLFKEINTTFLVPILKVPRVDSMDQFTSISLCNYFDKIISKVLASRIIKVLPSIIAPQQFVLSWGEKSWILLWLSMKLSIHWKKVREKIPPSSLTCQRVMIVWAGPFFSKFVGPLGLIIGSLNLLASWWLLPPCMCWLMDPSWTFSSLPKVSGKVI